MKYNINAELKKQPKIFKIAANNMVLILATFPIMLGLGALLALFKITSMVWIIMATLIFTMCAYLFMRIAEKKEDSQYFEKMLTFYFKQPLKITRHEKEPNSNF
jgi:hypothetical protein